MSNIVCNVCPKDQHFATPYDRIGMERMAVHFAYKHGQHRPLAQLHAWQERDRQTAELEEQVGV